MVFYKCFTKCEEMHRLFTDLFALPKVRWPREVINIKISLLRLKIENQELNSQI